MLGLTDIDLKQTRFYQDVFSEGHQEGRQEGRQQGHQEGRQEGRREEGVALVLRLLRRRCGEIAPALAAQVSQLSVSQLEALGEALLDFHDAVDLEQWLADRTSPASA